MNRAAFARQTAQALRPRFQIRGNATSSSSSSGTSTAQQKASEALGSAQKVAEKGFAQFQSATGKIGAKAGDLLGGPLCPAFLAFSVYRLWGVAGSC